MDQQGFELAFDQDKDILTVRYIGRLTLDVAKRALGAAFDEAEVTAETLVLLDATRAEVHDIDIEWFKSYQSFKEAEGYPSQTTALVVSGEESHQLLGQLWAAIRAARTSRTPGVFTDHTAAVEWLLERRRDLSPIGKLA